MINQLAWQRNSAVMHKVFTIGCIARLNRKLSQVGLPQGWTIELGRTDGVTTLAQNLFEVVIRLPENERLDLEYTTKLFDGERCQMACEQLPKSVNSAINEIFDLLNARNFGFLDYATKGDLKDKYIVINIKNPNTTARQNFGDVLKSADKKELIAFHFNATSDAKDIQISKNFAALQ